MGFCCAYPLAGQQEIPGAVVPGEEAPDHVLTVTGHLAARKVRGVLKVGVLGGKHDVAHDRHLGMHVARAVYRADHRNVDIKHVSDQMARIPGFFVQFHQTAGTGHQLILRLFHRITVGHSAPIGVVVLPGPGVDQHLDLAVARDIGERV